VTGVSIDGALHEFSAIDGVTEDVTELILNLKQINVSLLSDGPETLVLEANSEGDVSVSDFAGNPNVAIANPDLHIATLGPDATLRMEVTIGAGRGYVQAEEHVFEEKPIGFIPIDSVFSPVKRVHYDVENTRVGQHIDFDKLMLEVWTDGTVTPEDAVSFAAKILKDHLLLWMSFDIEPEEEIEEVIDEDQLRLIEILNHSVEELELSVRSSNCLRDASIRTLGDLVRKSEAEMLKYRNFGRKSLQELVDILSDMGLHFGMDVDSIMLPADAESDDDQGTEDEFVQDAGVSSSELSGENSDEKSDEDPDESSDKDSDEVAVEDVVDDDTL
jgi:DNA-directed RNA polymerase subunit alpha